MANFRSVPTKTTNYWSGQLESGPLSSQARPAQANKNNKIKFTRAEEKQTNFTSGPTKTTNSWSGQLESGLRSSQARPAQTNKINKKQRRNTEQTNNFQIWANRNTKFWVWTAGIEAPQHLGLGQASPNQQKQQKRQETKKNHQISDLGQQNN